MPPTSDVARYKDSPRADLVVRFYKWDYFFVVRPELRDSGFLRPLSIQDIDSTVGSLDVKHDTAVVLMGVIYDANVSRSIAHDWAARLGRLGFQHVVCLKGGDDMKLDGLPIIEDWRRASNEVIQSAIVQHRP